MWMAGGNVRGGVRVGRTDEFGLRAAHSQIPVRNVHATILSLMGLDDEELRYLHAGRLRQLTNIGGEVLTELIG
jgi:trimethylamine:corrinoid methyltransferase-like protein